MHHSGHDTLTDTASTEAAWDSPDSHIGVARSLARSIPYGIILDQYANPQNPLAHYHSTYPEIMVGSRLKTSCGKLTCQHALATSSLPSKHISLLIAGAGTGGTITGIARGIREGERETEHRATVVAVDPVGSILGGGEPGNYEVEGIGYVRSRLDNADIQDFFPEVLDPKPPLIDHWVKTEDKESFAATKRLM
jgi:cystathionine beta-synthase